MHLVLLYQVTHTIKQWAHNWSVGEAKPHCFSENSQFFHSKWFIQRVRGSPHLSILLCPLSLPLPIGGWSRAEVHCPGGSCSHMVTQWELVSATVLQMVFINYGDRGLTVALHCHAVVINPFFPLFLAEVLWRQGVSLGSSSANKRRVMVNVSTLANDTQTNTPTHISHHTSLAKRSITMWGRVCDRQIEREKCWSDRGSDKDWVMAYERQANKREKGRQRHEKYDRVGVEWVGTVCNERTSSKSDDFRHISSANGLVVFLHCKYVPWPPRQLLSRIDGRRLQFCHDITTQKYGKSNHIGHDLSFGWIPKVVNMSSESGCPQSSMTAICTILWNYNPQKMSFYIM